jgi:hypothetical protein
MQIDMLEFEKGLTLRLLKGIPMEPLGCLYTSGNYELYSCEAFDDSKKNSIYEKICETKIAQ